MADAGAQALSGWPSIRASWISADARGCSSPRNKLMNPSKTTPSQRSYSTSDGKRPNQSRNVRATALEILCSSSKVLTGREKIVLHWLAEGFPVGEIATRAQMAHRAAIKSSRHTRGGARSLSLVGPQAASCDQKKQNLSPSFSSASRDCPAPQL